GIVSSPRSVSPAPSYAQPAYRYSAPQPAVTPEPSYWTYSIEPLDVRPTDRVIVSRDNARLMDGRTVVGVIPSGHEFEVTKVVNGWLGAVVNLNGQELK